MYCPTIPSKRKLACPVRAPVAATNGEKPKLDLDTNLVNIRASLLRSTL